MAGAEHFNRPNSVVRIELAAASQLSVGNEFKVVGSRFGGAGFGNFDGPIWRGVDSQFDVPGPFEVGTLRERLQDECFEVAFKRGGDLTDVVERVVFFHSESGDTALVE